MLGRNTEWRQTDLLTDEQAHAMGLVECLGSTHCVVLISHDCDLASDRELFVEVIVGSLVQAADPMFANARNPRSLACEICIRGKRGDVRRTAPR